MNKKQQACIMVVVLVLCLVAARMIIFSPVSKDVMEISDSQMIWMICQNSDCQATYQIGLRVYFNEMEKVYKANPTLIQIPPLVCDKCGEESLYRAEKCPKCDLVFERGSMGKRDFVDRCPNPDCGFSATEAKSLERAKKIMNR